MGDLFSYGTGADKLSRRTSPATSVDAAKKVDTTKLEHDVHVAIAGYGREGCIASDLLEKDFPKHPYSSVTARFAALERRGFIRCGPEKRKGSSGRKQRVMVSIQAPT